MKYERLPANDGINLQKGFSLVELVMVMTIATILAGMSIFYLSGHQKMFRPDEQSLKLIDLLQEARQRSLTQRETMRVEINVSNNKARLVDENTSATEADDITIREIVLSPASEVNIETQPPDINTFPSDTLPIPIAEFRQSVYPTSVTQRVCTLRFLRDGTVYNAGTNPVANNATITSAALFIWSPKKDSPTQSDIARAITIVGTTGLIKFWEYNRASTEPNKWKDSRRTSVYGR